jgi:hypothetical protein
VDTPLVDAGGNPSSRTRISVYVLLPGLCDMDATNRLTMHNIFEVHQISSLLSCSQFAMLTLGFLDESTLVFVAVFEPRWIITIVRQTCNASAAVDESNAVLVFATPVRLSCDLIISRAWMIRHRGCCCRWGRHGGGA